MATQQQINNFRNWARQQGYSELEIQQEIARKQQEETRATIQPNQQPQQPQIPVTQPNPQPTTTQPVAQPQGGNMVTNAVSSVANFLIPRTTQTVKTIAKTFDLNKNTTALKQANEQLFKQAQDLIDQANRETDPMKKKQLIQKSIKLNKLAADNTTNFSSKVDQFQKETGIKGDEDAGDYLRQSIGVAGEAATWMLPVSKIVPGAQLIKGTGLVSKILRGVINKSAQGAVLGGVNAATNPEDITLTERATDTIKGATIAGATNVALGAAGEVLKLPKKAIDGFVRDNEARVYNLFRINPAERQAFRKATQGISKGKGLNFAEEILKRDAKEMAGKDYGQLLEHFTTRIDEAVSNVDDLLSKNTQTIHKNVIASKIKSMIQELNPKKGNVGQGEVVNKLNSILADVKKNPQSLSMATLNEIKRQLQDIGEAAFSPSGKASPTSKKVAALSTFVKELIENKVEGIKDANATIQLYQLAKKGIERTGDREANKISNDLIQKFLQVLPAAAGAGIGFYGGGAEGGVTGLILGQLLSGGIGAARINYFSPETQTKLIAQLKSVAEKQGIPNSESWASKIAQAIGDVITKKTAQTVSSIPGDMRQQEKGILESIQDEEFTPKTELEQTDEITTEEEQAPEVVTIRNKTTGETKTVSKEELGMYGLGEQTQTSALPTKKDILAAMILDMRTGGKNIAELNTILQAYEKVYEEEEEEEKPKKIAATTENKIQLANSGLRALTQLEGILKKDPSKVLKNVIPGKLGSRDYDSAAFRAVEGLLRARSGAAVPETEVRRYMNANLPRIGDTDEDIKFKLESFRKDLEDVANSSGYTDVETELNK